MFVNAVLGQCMCMHTHVSGHGELAGQSVYQKWCASGSGEPEHQSLASVCLCVGCTTNGICCLRERWEREELRTKLVSKVRAQGLGRW